jgi:hypothetical protein
MPEVPGKIISEATEQRRAAVEQVVPVHGGEPVAVAVVEAAGAHQVQLAALVDPADVVLPADGAQHFARQLLVVQRRGALAAALELLAASLEQFQHARPLLVVVEIVVQARRLQDPSRSSIRGWWRFAGVPAAPLY